MEGTAGAVVATEHPMVNRCVSQRALSHETFCVKVKAISAHYVVSKSAAVDRRDEFDVLFLHLQCRRNRGIATIGKKCVRLTPGGVQPFDHRKGFADIRPGSAMDLIVSDDFMLSVIIAGLGDMKAVARPFMSARGIRVVGGLKGSSFSLLLHVNRFLKTFTLLGEEAGKQLIGPAEFIFLEDHHKFMEILRSSPE